MPTIALLIVIRSALRQLQPIALFPFLGDAIILGLLCVYEAEMYRTNLNGIALKRKRDNVFGLFWIQSNHSKYNKHTVDFLHHADSSDSFQMLHKPIKKMGPPNFKYIYRSEG